MPQREEVPKWSIRRSICPVCSQKWRDRSTINIIKSSGIKDVITYVINISHFLFLTEQVKVIVMLVIIIGLRRNLSYEPPSVKAPARIRTSVAMDSYVSKYLLSTLDNKVLSTFY